MGVYKTWTVDAGNLTRSELKHKLWEDLRLKAELGTSGIDITEEALEAAEIGTRHQEQLIGGGRNRELWVKNVLPGCIYTPYGLKVTFTWNRFSPYRIVLENGKHILTNHGNAIGEIGYAERPKHYDKLTSDGTPFQLIGTSTKYDRLLYVTYSNECSYKERNEDCHFCNINYDKDLYTEKYGTFWRTPKQIAETVKASFDEGITDHVTISGGVIAERRELEYFVDAAEAIKKVLNAEEFNGTAVVAAPTDFSSIDKFREAGFRTVAMNLELWDKDYYKAVCPGKAHGSGGWDNWVNALRYAVKAFGYARVRSNFVAGIEPKAKTAEGFEILSADGVVCSFNIWSPNVGSDFEGHRSPVTSWYLDLAGKLAYHWKKNGFTFDQIHDATAGDWRLPTDVFRIENEIFDIFDEAK